MSTSISDKVAELYDRVEELGHTIDEFIVDDDSDTSASALTTLLSAFDDMKFIEIELKNARQKLETALCESMTGPMQVGSSVYSTKAKPVLVWDRSTDHKSRLLRDSARRDNALTATIDGESIPEPAYAQGWEAASSLWNTSISTMKKTTLEALHIDPESEGWCHRDRWAHTLTVTR